MTVMATLTAKTSEQDPQTITFSVDGGSTPLIKAEHKFKSGRTQTKTYPGVNIESRIIDELIANDGYHFTLSDELKRYRISWAVEPTTKEDREWMGKVLKALGAEGIKLDPLADGQFVLLGLEFTLSVIGDDSELSVAFWSNKLTDEQAACLRCLNRLKPRMVDESNQFLDANSAFASTIAGMARRADLGDTVNAALDDLGASYRPFDFGVLAKNAGSLSVDF